MWLKVAIALLISTCVAQGLKRCGCRSRKPAEEPPVCNVAALGLPAEAVVNPPFSSPPMTDDVSILTSCDEGFTFEVIATCTADGFAFSVDCVMIEPGKRSTNKREARGGLVGGLLTRTTQPVCNNKTFEFEIIGTFHPPFSHPAVEGEQGTINCDDDLGEIVQITCTESGFEITAFCT